MAIFQPQIVGKGGETYIAGKGINIDEESKEISVVDPVLVNESTIEGVVQIGDYELLDSNGTIPEDRLANTTSAIQGQILTLDINKNAIWADPDALPASTKYGANLVLSIDSSTYVVTAQLKDQDGNNLGSSQTIDLPLESVVVSGRYDEPTKKVILTLQNGSTVEFSIADLIDGLQNQMQFSNMPEASSTNEGMIVQYVGETDSNYTNGYFYKCVDNGSSATISQTVGSSLSNLKINVEKFVETEQPSGSETVRFEYSSSGVTVTPTSGSNYGLSVEIIDATTFWAKVEEEFSHWGVGTLRSAQVWYSNTAGFKLQVYNENPSGGGYNYTWHSMSDAANCGLSFSGTASNNYFAVTTNIIAIPTTPNWKKNNNNINVQDYGISYTGVPTNGDTLTVVYTEGVSSYSWNTIQVQEAGGAVDSVNGKTGVVVLNASDVGALPDSTIIPAAQVNSDWNANSGVAQILNKPTIPTVNNPTITFTQGGVTKGRITLNQSSSQTIAFDAGGGGGSGAVDSVNGKTGAVILDAKDVSAIPQYSELPEITESNANSIVQYVGETVPDSYEKGYFYMSNPTYSEPSVTMEQTGGPVDSATFETTSGNVTISGTVDAIKNLYRNYIGGSPKGGTITITYGTPWQSTWWNFAIHDEGGEESYPGTQSTFVSNGFTFTGNPTGGEEIECTYTVGNISNLQIDEEQFMNMEDPEPDETVVFSASGGTPMSATASVSHSTDPELAVSINAEEYYQFAINMVGDEEMARDAFRTATLEFYEEEGWTDEETGEYYPGESYWILTNNYGDNYDWLSIEEVGVNIVSGYTFPGDMFSISFTPEGGASWSKDSSPVTLDEYGIYYEGMAREGDEISVTYSSGGVIGGEWEQINVQPGSSGGDYLPLSGGTVTGRVTFDKTDCAFTAQAGQYTDKWRWKAVTSPERGLGFLSYENTSPLLTITGFGGIIPYNTSSAAQTLGDNYHSWYTLYTRRINNGNDITIPTVAGSMAVQISNMPTASNKYVDQIYQYVGTTNATYTNGRFYKCVLNGQAYAWEEVLMSSESPLPDQTGQSGKFLTTNGTNASWATVDALPSQASQSGKFLTTNGSTASWNNPVVATFRVWGANE